MRDYVMFGLPTAVIAGVLFFWIYSITNWNPYAIWLVVLSVATFGIYGIDKMLSKTRARRVPENMLNVLALLGGFAGGWAGMAVFHHKSNYRKHPIIWLFLILAPVVHAMLAYYWFFLQG